MYNLLKQTIVSYIKSVVDANFEVFDANKVFIEPQNYASFYLLLVDPNSPHENLIDTHIQNIDLVDYKRFVFSESSIIHLRIDFRGDEAIENMSLFKASFYKEVQQDILNNAGFGYLGLDPVLPISDLRDVQSKDGLTTTLKLSVTEIISDDSQIIQTFDVKVSNKL